jgi:hypothetical protein
MEMPMEKSRKHSLPKRLDPKPIVNETRSEASETADEPDGEALCDFLRQMKDHNATVVRPSFTKRRQRKAA